MKNKPLLKVPKEDQPFNTPACPQKIELTFWDNQVAFIKSRMENATASKKPRTWTRDSLYDL